MAPAGVPDGVGDSPRVRLARVSLEAACAVPGVVGTDAGPHRLWVTADPVRGLLRGVSVIAQRDGRYSVNLCLIARLVPLMALGEEVQTKVRARVGRAGLAADLGAISVEFAGVLTGEEIAAQAAAVEREAAERALASSPAPSELSSSTPVGELPLASPDQEPGS